MESSFYIFDLASALRNAAAGHRLAGHVGVAWPAFLAANGWPDVDGGLLLKLLGTIGGVLFIVATFTAILKNIRDLRAKPTPAPPTPQPLIITMKEQFVEREVFEELKVDTHNQIKEIRAYAHDEIHGVLGELKSLYKAVEQREKRLDEKLETHWKELTRERSISTANLHKRLEETDRQMRSEVDTKIKEVREDIKEMPGSIVSLLRETGAIGGHRS